MFDLGDHRIRHTTVQDRYRRYLVIMSRSVGGDVTTQREPEQSDAARGVGPLKDRRHHR